MKQTLFVFIFLFSLSVFSQDTKMKKGIIYCYVPLTINNFDFNKEYKTLVFFIEIKEQKFKKKPRFKMIN